MGFLLGIGVAGNNREARVDLLGKQDAGELVRESQRRKRKLSVGPAAQRFGKASGIAAQEDKFARAGVAVAGEPARELFGSELLSRGIEQNDHCRGGSRGVELEIAQGRGGIAELERLDLRVTANAA